MTWRPACLGVDLDVFYPTGKTGPGGVGPDYSEARWWCGVCPAATKARCAAEVLAFEAGRPLSQRHGFCGGMTPEDRHRLDVAAPRSVKVSISDEARELRQELYNQGRTDADIADRCGVTVLAVRSWRNRNMLPPHDDADEKDRERLYRDGLTDSAIGRVLGQTRDVVRGWRIRAGLPPNNVSVS